MAYGRKDYLGSRATTTLNGSINDSTTSITITSATGWPSVSNTGFYAVIDPDSATEEKVFVTARSGTGLTATRGVDGTTGVAHASGATIRPCFTAVDFDEANYMVTETVGNITAAGDLLVASAANNLTRLAKGSNSTILAVDSGGTLGYTTAATAMFADSAVSNAKLAGMTRGTVKVGDSSGVASDLALGASGYYLKSDGTDVTWATMYEWTTLRKAANQSITATADVSYDDDNTITFTTGNGTYYRWEAFIVYTVGTAASEYLSLHVGRSYTGTVLWKTRHNDAGVPGPYSNTAESPGTTGWAGAGSTKRVAFLWGTILGSGSTFKFAWARSPAGSSTPVIYAGSYFRYRDIS